MKKITAIEKDKHLEKLLQEVTKRVFDRYNDIEGKEKQPAPGYNSSLT